MSVNDLSTLLWRERELLELLVFKLEEEQLLLTAGRSKWLHHATREVEQVLGHLRTTGIERTVEASSVAVQWGLAEDATLRQLAEGAPDEVWRDAAAVPPHRAHRAHLADRGRARHEPRLPARRHPGDAGDARLRRHRPRARGLRRTRTAGRGRRRRPPLRPAGLSMSTFGGLSIGYTGLVAARKALEVTGQNVANANTEGYTRQRVTQAPLAQTALATFVGQRSVGDGVTRHRRRRLNDSVVDARVNSTAVHGRVLEQLRRPPSAASRRPWASRARAGSRR